MRFRLLMLALLTVLPALALILYSSVQERNYARQQAEMEALRVTRLVATTHQTLLQNTQQLLLILSHLPQTQAFGPECDNFLATLQARFPNYTALAVYNSRGQPQCVSSPSAANIQIAGQPFFERALSQNRFQTGEYQVNLATGTAILPFAYPVVDEQGQVRAVLLAALNLAWLNEVAPNVDLPSDSAVLLVDSEGVVLSRYPDTGNWIGTPMPEAPIISSILSQQGNGTTLVKGLDGVERLYAFTSLGNSPEQDVYVSIGLPSRVAFADAQNTLMINLISLAAVVALVLLLAWFGSQSFVLRHVDALVAATRRLAAGDLQARSGIQHQEGEFGQLAQAFDQMANTLQQRQEQLRRAEARYRSLVEQIPAIIYTGLQENPEELVYVSPQIHEMLGFSADEWLADPDLWRMQIHAEDRQRVTDQMAQAWQNNAPFQAEYRLLTHNGHTVWVRDESIIVQEEGARTSFRQGIILDITERKEAEMARESYAYQLERSNRELQDFAYIASHDLQEPLRKIQAFGERLDTKYKAGLGEEGQMYIERMRSGAERLQTLINDLLNYSRVTTKGRPFVPIDLHQVVEQVISDLEARLDGGGGRVELGELPVVEADRVQMTQLLQNLVGNALKFHRPDVPPVVKISCRPAGTDFHLQHPTQHKAQNYVQILIEDNGIGFEEKYLDRIFLPFQRLHARNDYEGSGMGLAICRKIVERHNGEITAKSEPGVGTTFIVTLPVEQVTRDE